MPAWSRPACLVAVACGLCFAPACVFAAHPVVPAFERFHSQGEATAQGGELLLGELNCTSCHTAEKSPLINVKQAPILDNVGSRVRPEYIREFLNSPHEVKPGTTMPDPFAGWQADEKKAAIEGLTHYLALSGAISDQRIQPAAVGKGDALFHSLGCVACHDAQKKGSEKLATSVPLGELGKKYTIASLTTFLQEPSKVRPSGRMPTMNLEGEEARSLASFLLRDLKDLKVPANLQYTLVEGSFTKLPDFAKAKITAQGETFGFDLGFAPNKDNFAVRFTGTINIPRDGDYRINIGSDDGSRIYIDDKLVVDHDGIHGKNFKDGIAKLKAGKHAVTVDFFEASGGEELEVTIQHDSIGQQPLENLLVVEKTPDPMEKKAFVVDPTLAEKGKIIFAEVGCASCHQIHAGKEKIESKLTSPALAGLKNSGGCLSDKPAKGTPFFSLNDMQRKALAAGIAALQKPAPQQTAQDTIARTIKTLNCVACHQRGELGGIEEARNVHFQTTQKEMGDEGRIPPPLTGIGAKLRPTWLKEQLEVSPKERPYMLTRMPRFIGFPMADLIDAFTKADPLIEVKKVDTSAFSLTQVKNAGYTMVGSKGFSCIKCHTWGNTQATGIQSINMQRMNARLNQGWMEAYLLNPMQFRPGTRMPASWPEGQVLLPKMLDGKADTQIRAVWDYLADGSKARTPLGLGRDPIELVPETEPIIYRNFIEGGGPRAIGVGYPEKVNLVFDANTLRLAIIWQGAFMDASKHWVDRGAGFQPPLGDNVLNLASGAPFAALADDNTAWPKESGKEAGYQFKGYRYDKLRRPSFQYKFGDAEVNDEIIPVVSGEQLSFHRTLTIKSATPLDHVWFRAAVESDIKAEDGGLFAMPDKWHMKLSGDGKPVVRKNSGKAELLVPVTLKDGTMKIVQEIVW